MCLTHIPSHNSRDTFRAKTQGTPARRPSRYHQSLVDHTHPKQAKHSFTSAISPDVAPDSPGTIRFQTAWRRTRAARCQAPLIPLSTSIA